MSADQIKRILLVGSAHYGYVVPAIQLLRRWKAEGFAGATLVVRDRTGVEASAAGYWRNAGGTVERPEDLIVEADRADILIACIGRYDDDACHIMWHVEAQGRGWPAITELRGTGVRQPTFRPGTEQAEGRTPAAALNVPGATPKPNTRRKATRR